MTAKERRHFRRVLLLVAAGAFVLWLAGAFTMGLLLLLAGRAPGWVALPVSFAVLLLSIVVGRALIGWWSGDQE